MYFQNYSKYNIIIDILSRYPSNKLYGLGLELYY